MMERNKKKLHYLFCDYNKQANPSQWHSPLQTDKNNGGDEIPTERDGSVTEDEFPCSVVELNLIPLLVAIAGGNDVAGDSTKTAACD